jgi:hypothetical protein
MRESYTDRMAFLIAPLGAPNGQDFGCQFGLDNGSVVLFSPQGVAVNTVHRPANTAELKQGALI